MPANGALTAGELVSLNNINHVAPYYLSYRKDVVIATATVSATPTGNSYAKLLVSGTSANWLTARSGEACKVTDSTGTILRGYYRIRISATASTYIVIEEIAPADPGLITSSFRTGAIQAGDLISVIERYDLYAVKPHTSAGQIYQDWDTVVGTHNTAPEPIVNITINGAAGDYVTMISSDAGTQAITAVATVTKWATSSGSTVSYAWAVPASWTGGGGGATATLTGNAPPGDYILYLQITDSIAGTFTVNRWIRIHSPGDPPLKVNITSDGTDLNMRKITIRAVKGVISAIPPGAKCAIWGPMTWGGIDVASARHGMVGYLYQQPFNHVPAFYETTADIYSTAAMLDTLMCAPAVLKYAGTPVTWEQLPTSLQTVQFAMWWVLRWRCGNFLQTFNFTPLSTATNTGRKINIGVGQGSIMSQLKALADMYDANIGCRADGELISVILPWMKADQSGLVYRGTFDNTMYNNVVVKWLRHPPVGYVRHEGFTSDLTADVAVAADAPGLQTYGQGSTTDKRTGKIYESQSDANASVGCALAHLDAEYPQIDLDFYNNWDVFEPADCLPMTVTVPANKSPTGAVLSIKCVPSSISKTWILGRGAKVHVTAVGLTNGYAGQTVPPPPVVPTPPPVAIILPPSSILPPVGDPGGIGPPTPTPTGQPAKFTGEGLFVGSNTDAYVLRNFISLTTPQSTKVTPSDITNYAIQAVLIEPSPTSLHIGGYVLAYNALTDMSAVWYTPHLAAPAPDWTKGADQTGKYTVVRGSNVAGSVVIDNPGGGSTVVATYDFTVNNQGFVLATGTTGGRGTYVAGVGWQNTDSQNGAGEWFRGVGIQKTGIASFDCNRALALFDITFGTLANPSADFGLGVAIPDTSGVFVINRVSTSMASGNNQTIAEGDASATGQTAVQVFLDTDSNLSSSSGFTGSCTLKKLILYKGGAVTRLSTDYGATFAAPVTVGASAAVLGFDIPRNSATNYAACAAKVRKATTLGGAYADFVAFTGANPVCVVIPYYRWGTSTDQTAVSDPDFIAALDTADSGGGTLYKINGTTGGKTDITPVAGITFDNANCVTTHYGTKIYVFGKVSGVYKLYYSNNTGSTWTLVGTRTSPTFIRGRRNNLLLARPQIYLADSGSMYFTSYGYTGPTGTPFIRNMPDQIVSFDTLWSIPIFMFALTVLLHILAVKC